MPGTVCIWYAQNFKGKEVVFVYISLDKDKKAWETFVNTQNIEGVHLVAAGNNVYQSQIAKLYKVKRLPALFLVDKSGRIAYNSSKDAGSGQMSEFIEQLLQGN